MAIEDWPYEARVFLPPWFDLKSYEAARGWTPMRWISEIRKRKMYFLDLPWKPYDGKERAIFGLPDLQPEEIDKLNKRRKQLFISQLECDFKILTESDSCIFTEQDKREIEREMRSPVQTPNFHDFAKTGRLLSQSRFYNFVDELEDLDPQDLDESDAAIIFSPYDAAIYLNRENHYACVDLRIPDHLLRDAFDRWLQQERARLGIPNPKPIIYSRRKRMPKTKPTQGEKRAISKSDIKKWVDWRVLPYLDIGAWLLIKGAKKEPTSGVWESILFPNHMDNSNQPPISDLKKLADWLLGTEVCGLLRALGLQNVTK